MDERVLWGLSAVLLMALLMEADPERLWALTQVLVLGALEGLLKGVLLGFWLFNGNGGCCCPWPCCCSPPCRCRWRCGPRPGPGWRPWPVCCWACCSMAASSGGWCPSWTGSRRCLFCSGRPPKLARRRPLRQLSELLFHRPRPALSLAVGAVGTVKRFPGSGSRWPLGNIRNGKMPL